MRRKARFMGLVTGVALALACHAAVACPQTPPREGEPAPSLEYLRSHPPTPCGYRPPEPPVPPTGASQQAPAAPTPPDLNPSEPVKEKPKDEEG